MLARMCIIATRYLIIPFDVYNTHHDESIKMKSYTDIEADELVDLISKANTILVDVRNPDEVARGMIPGATHIQLSMLPLQYERLLKANNVVFYCHSGIRSAHAADFAISKGVTNVHNLIGGVLGWSKAGYKLNRN